MHNEGMPTEKELLERVRQLEEQNSALQDKLDMIYAILAPDFDEAGEDPVDDDNNNRFVQIESLSAQKKFD
jgi:hypothetical protein